MAQVVLENLIRSYVHPGGRSVNAVDALNLEIRDGEFLVLVGPSGSGKTTTLRLIAGLEKPTSGTVRIGGRIADNLRPSDRGVAMVFQSFTVYPHMTVRQNIDFAMKVRHFQAAEIETRIADLSRQLRLEPLLDRRPADLSGGECQRAALARAIAGKPSLLMMDEPLSQLDGPLRSALRAELCELKKTLGSTVLYVTHDYAEAMVLGDRIAVLREGRLQQVGAPRDIYAAPASVFVAQFFGTPPMNLFAGRLLRGEDGLQFVFERGAGSIRLPADCERLLTGHESREVLLGLRPEHIGAATGEGYEASATVDRVQEIGPEIHVFCDSEQGQVVFSSRPALRFQRGECLRLRLDMSQSRFFDATSGQALNKAAADHE